MVSSPTPKPQFTLFVTILTLFLATALLVGLGVTVADYFENRGSALGVAAEIFKDKIDRINEGRLAFFAPPSLIAEQLRDEPTFRNPSASKDPILKMILSSLVMNPQISAVYAGYESGDFFQILSISGKEKSFLEGLRAPPVTRFAVEEIDAGKELWKFLDSEGRQIGTLDNREINYDPRSREWYRDARAQPELLVRTPLYLFATTGQIGMTLSRAFDGGAVGVDITLDRLMSYVRSFRSNENQRFIAFDDQRRLLADFDPDQMFKVSVQNGVRVVDLATTADLSDPVITKAVRVFESKGPYDLARFDVDGLEYLATVVKQAGKYGNGFYVLYAAPLSDFMGPLLHAAARNILAAILIFVLALPAIVYLAHSISKPLRQLSVEAELIQSFQLAAPIKAGSRVREVNTLIRSMSGMKAAIREVTKFVPKTLVRELVENEGTVDVGGATRRVSILFSDIRDFTAIAEAMPAEDLTTKLSEYFEELVSLIIGGDGTVDKFIGDAVFAFWNAPLPTERHEHMACMTALKCRAALRRLNERWAEKGLVSWHTRFGVHVGDAVLGNVGSSDRLDYTAIGDTVNVASRLEGLNKYYGTGILASGEIAKLCSDQFLFRRVDRSRPKGAGMSLDIFELLGTLEGSDEYRVTPEMVRLVEDWNRVYEVYAAQDWLRTLDALEEFAADHPDDVVAGIYLSRTIEFLLEPPPADWDGVIHFSRK